MAGLGDDRALTFQAPAPTGTAAPPGRAGQHFGPKVPQGAGFVGRRAGGVSAGRTRRRPSRSGLSRGSSCAAVTRPRALWPPVDRLGPERCLRGMAGAGGRGHKHGGGGQAGTALTTCRDSDAARGAVSPSPEAPPIGPVGGRRRRAARERPFDPSSERMPSKEVLRQVPFEFQALFSHKRSPIPAYDFAKLSCFLTGN